jgi:hypothetical protein
MNGFRTIWGVGLCLGLTGCAATHQGVALGPAAGPGARPVLIAHSLPQPHVHCGCGPTQRPVLPPAPMTSEVPPAEATMTLARFFPRLHESDGVPADPLETVRPDPLGVRTTLVVPTVLRDGGMVLAAAEERSPDLPLIMKIASPPDTASPSPAPVTSVDMIEPSPVSFERAPENMPVAAEGPTGDAVVPPGPPGPASPQPVGAIGLEYVDDPALAGRPRLAADGTLIPGPRPVGDPTGYGPDPTYPASYSAGGSSPASVPRTREVWPTRRPWRPTMLSWMFQRFRKPEGAKPAGPGSSQGEPGDLAKRRQGVERIASDRPDEPAQR